MNECIHCKCNILRLVLNFVVFFFANDKRKQMYNHLLFSFLFNCSLLNFIINLIALLEVSNKIEFLNECISICLIASSMHVYTLIISLNYCINIISQHIIFLCMNARLQFRFLLFVDIHRYTYILYQQKCLCHTSLIDYMNLALFLFTIFDNFGEFLTQSF